LFFDVQDMQKLKKKPKVLIVLTVSSEPELWNDSLPETIKVTIIRDYLPQGDMLNMRAVNTEIYNFVEHYLSPLCARRYHALVNLSRAADNALSLMHGLCLQTVRQKHALLFKSQAHHPNVPRDYYFDYWKPYYFRDLIELGDKIREDIKEKYKTCGIYGK
jgi:hypothetical protein